MWFNNRASKILKAQYPILLGPFGGNLSSVKLTALVSNMGGVGGFGAYTLTPDEIFNTINELKKATGKPYNINLWVSDTDAPNALIADDDYERVSKLFKPYFDELSISLPPKPGPFKPKFEDQVEVVLQQEVPVFSFMFGIPSATVLQECKKRNIVTIGAATTLDEAIALEAAEVDLIIASGFEAGGHRPSFMAPSEASLTGTFVLIQQIKEKVRTPIIEAGGIANGKGVAAALTLGAEAAQVGTAFLACEESNAPEVHRQILFAENSKYTVLTRAFTGRLGRGIRSRISEDMRTKENGNLPFPLQAQFMSVLRKEALARQKWDMVLFWAGQIAPVLKHRKAAELMEALVRETNEIFSTNQFNDKK